MRMIWNKGHRIRASDKHLVYHFSIETLLFVFVAVLLLLNSKQLMRTDWEHFSLLENGLTLSPYNFITILIATGVCALVAFGYYRFCYDSFKKLLHRQKLARMILENKWYEADTVQDSGFFTDLQSRSREKIVWFPKIYYQMEKGLLHIRCEITLGKYQDQLLRLEDKLESGFIVRYADDFKIMCSTYEEAQRFYHSTVDFLNKRLKLEISPEKSKVVNLKKNSSDFLGFKIKVIPKGKTKHGYVAKTDMNQKALKKAKTNLKLKVKDIVRHTTTFQIARYNLAVMGMQNYYCVATNIYNNLTEVSYALLPTTRVRFKKIAKLIPFETTSQDFQMKTTGIRPQTKIIMIADTPLLPINGVKHKNPLNFSQDICNFTEHGRSKIHEEIALVTKGEIRILLEYKDTTKSVEFNDNRISVFIAQQGNCYITNRRHSPTDMVCIYKNITETDRDKYQNLVFVEIPISKAILTESVQQAKMWLMNYGLSSQQKKKLNKIRANYGYQAIK